MKTNRKNAAYRGVNNKVIPALPIQPKDYSLHVPYLLKEGIFSCYSDESSANT